MTDIPLEEIDVIGVAMELERPLVARRHIDAAAALLRQQFAALEAAQRAPWSLTELQRDAELWRAYQARKDAALAAGLGRSPLRTMPAKSEAPDTNPYATAEETAGLVRRLSPLDRWLEEQLDRISPERHEMGGPAPALAYLQLVLELKDTNTQLQGEAKVMRELLERSLAVLESIDEEDDHERALLKEFKRKIVAVVEMQMVRP